MENAEIQIDALSIWYVPLTLPHITFFEDEKCKHIFFQNY